MAQVVQYTVTSNVGFIFITGVVGTSVEGVAYSLAIANINKIVVSDLSGIINIFMNSSANHMFKYSELIDPLTGLPFGNLSDALTFLLGIFNSNAGSSTSGLVYNSDQVYSSAAGDFIAAVVPGTKTITIVGLAFPISEVNLAAIQIVDINLQHVNLPINNTSVLAGVLTIPLAPDNFLATDIAVVTIVGVQKKYDAVLDADRVIVQNPDWTHTTVGVLLGSDDYLGALSHPCDNAIPSADFEYSTGGLLTSNISFTPQDGSISGGNLVNITGQMVGEATAITDTSIVAAMSGAAVWTSGDIASIPEVRRYIVPMDTYNYLSIQAKLLANVGNELRLAIFGSNNPLASASSDDDWCNITPRFDPNGTAYSFDATQVNLYLVLTNAVPITIENIMIRVDGYILTPNDAPDNSFEIYIKKSY